MATKRGIATRRRRQKQKRATRRYRRDPYVRRGRGTAPPKVQNNLVLSSNNNEPYSPVSTPGTNNNKNNKAPNSPITMKAKMLASLYPNRETMIKRSMSFESSNKVNNNAWWKQMEEEWGTENQEYFP